MDPNKAKIIRRVCSILILLSMAYVSVPMIVSAYVAIENNEAIDPFTNKVFDTNETGREICVVEGGKLLEQIKEHSITLEDFDSKLYDLHECRALHPKIYSLLKERRKEIENK